MLLLYASVFYLFVTTGLALGLLVFALLLVVHDDRLDFGHGAFDQNWMTSDVLALHLASSLEIIIAVGKADETEPFAFRRALVTYDSCLLN